MKKTILINGKPFTYEAVDLKYENLSPISVEDAQNLLRMTKSLFNEVGLKFYLAFGTLLGAVRDKGLIKGDEDVDVYVDDLQTFINNIPYFNEKGYKLIRVGHRNLFSFRVNGTAYIDVYIKRPCGISLWGGWCCLLNGNVTPKKYLAETQTISFLGEECLCPKDPERILKFWYGKNWRTPVRGHELWYYEIPIAYHWHKKIKPAIQKLIGWEKWKHYIRKGENEY